MDKKHLRNEFDMGLLSKYRVHLFAAAIVMVVFHHLTFKTSDGLIAQGYMFLRVTGAVGVDVFLFLSGFGCYYSYSKDENTLEFYKRRLIRILPAYFAISIPAYFVTDILIEKVGVVRYLLDVSLLSFWVDGGSDWYIAASLVLYFLFPFFYKVGKKYRYGNMALILAWGGACVIINCISHDYLEITGRLWARIPVFLTGVFLAPLIKEHYVIHNWRIKFGFVIAINILALLVEGIFALKGAKYAYSFWARLFYCPLGVSLMLILTCMFDKLKMRRLNQILLFLGGITLEIYMLNQRMMDGCTYLMRLISDKNVFVLLGNLAGILITVCLSYIVHNMTKSNC